MKEIVRICVPNIWQKEIKLFSDFSKVSEKEFVVYSVKYMLNRFYNGSESMIIFVFKDRSLAKGFLSLNTPIPYELLDKASYITKMYRISIEKFVKISVFEFLQALKKELKRQTISKDAPF